jgi:colanic acid/amylovoran biosynthesis protein
MNSIVIKGAGFVNKGAEAMLRTVQAQLSSRVPGIEIGLWQLRAAYRPAAVAAGFTPLQLPCTRDRFPWTWIRGTAADMLWGVMSVRGAGRLRQLAALPHRERFLAGACEQFLRKKFPDPDCVLDISGFAYGDAFGPAAFAANRYLPAYCRRRGIPYICLPQAWGSFRKPGMAAALREFAGAPGVVLCARDRRSAGYLAEALGRAPGSIPVAPDIAFAFSSAGRLPGEQRAARMCLGLQRPIVGVGPSMRVYERAAGRGPASVYLRALVHFIRHVIAAYDVDVVVQPNEIDAGGAGFDDRYLCSMIVAAVGRPDRCGTVTEPMPAEDVHALIGRFSCLVGSRYHGLIFALSQGVPCLAIGWSHKYAELLSQFGLEHAVQEVDGIDAPGLIAAFEDTWARRDALRPVIAATARRLQQQCTVFFDELAGTLFGPERRA